MSEPKPNKNAIIHGLYSNSTVIDGEKPEDFEILLQAFRDEYDPEGVSEDAAVFELASLEWKRNRLAAGLQRALNMQLASDLAEGSGVSWDRVAGAARNLAKAQSEAAQIVSRSMARDLAGATSLPDQPPTHREAAQIENEKKFVQELNIISKELLLPLLHIVEKQKQDQIERAYNPDIMERALKIEAEIDRRIEKKLRHLVMAKEYKKMYVRKSVGSTPAQIEVPFAKPISEKTDTTH
jgi:hypothetical protein